MTLSSEFSPRFNPYPIICLNATIHRSIQKSSKRLNAQPVLPLLSVMQHQTRLGITTCAQYKIPQKRSTCIECTADTWGQTVKPESSSQLITTRVAHFYTSTSSDRSPNRWINYSTRDERGSLKLTNPLNQSSKRFSDTATILRKMPRANSSASFNNI